MKGLVEMDILKVFENQVSDEVINTISSPKAYATNISRSVMIILICLVMTILINKLIEKFSQNFQSKKRLRKANSIFFFCVAAILILITWVNTLNALILLVIFLSLFGVILIRELLDNIIGWYIISKRRYFKRNDRIEINGVIGNVVNLGFFYFELAEVKNWLTSETLTGRSIKIPNKQIFDYELFNYSQIDHYTWQELSYTIRYDDDWKAAKKIMMDTVNQYYIADVLPHLNQEIFALKEINNEPVFNLDINDVGVTLSVIFLSDYSKIAAIKTALNEPILDAFNQNEQINFAVFDIRQTK